MSNTERIAGISGIAPGDIAINPLILGTWFALLAGLGDVFLYLVSRVVLHRLMHQSLQLVWIAPVSSMFLFGLPALILLALARRRPERQWLFPSAAVFAFLMAWGLSCYATRIHPLAALVLSLGIAVQTARVVTAHPRGMRRIVRTTLPAMAALVALGGLSFNGWRRLSESRAVAELPLAAPGAPNVLLIILDTVRALNLSLYGYTRQTSPALERFARRGIVFDRAISAAPWTLPSHASLFTGRWPHELSADWRVPLDATYPTLAEVLAQRGYATAGFVANAYNAGEGSGLARGFTHYEDFKTSVGTILLGSALGRYLTGSSWLRRVVGYYDEIGRKRASEVNAEVLHWITRRNAGGRPFFAFVNYYDAHSPYLPPAPFDTLFDKLRIPPNPLLVNDRPTTPSEVLGDVAAYDESLAALDHALGLLLDELDRRGVLGNTIVIITADHGEEFGEHGLLEHGNSLYIQALHVPLLVVFPGSVPRGVRISQPVTLRDLPATVLALAGPVAAGSGSSPELPGYSLARFWKGRTTTMSGSGADVLVSEVRYARGTPRWYPVSKGDMASLVDSTQHLIRSGDGATELYAIDSDPGEQRNVANQPVSRTSARRLAAMLRATAPINARH